MIKKLEYFKKEKLEHYHIPGGSVWFNQRLHVCKDRK